MNNKNELVVKANCLVEASYRLSLSQQRLILLSITESRRTGTGLTVDSILVIRAADYAETFDVPLNEAYVQLKDAGHSLFMRYVVLYDWNPKTKRNDKINLHWLSYVKYKEGEGEVEIQFSQQMVPYITRLESHFTKYTLGMIANMSSSHAIRIYELLIQWGGIGRREMEIAWLRNLLRLENQYTSINDFKKYVVDISVLQINKFTDLSVSYTQKKTGRSVTHLIFTFSQKPNTKQTVPTQSGNAVAKPSKQPPLPAATQEVDGKEDSESPFRFAKAAITPKTQCEYLKLRTAEEIELCIERANEYGGEQEKAGKPVRYGAVYRKAIVEGWHEEKARQKAQQAEDAAKKEASKQAAEKARRTEAEKKELGKMETELSAAWFSALPEDDKHALGVAYVAESNRIDVENFKHKGYTYIGFQLFIKKKWLESKQASVTKGASHEPARANT